MAVELLTRTPTEEGGEDGAVCVRGRVRTRLRGREGERVRVE